MFILSQTIFWRLFSKIFGDNKIIYVIFQFVAASYFLLYSIALTKDNIYFNRFWQNSKHIFLKTVIDKILHYSTCFTIGIPLVIMRLVEALSGSRSPECEDTRKIVERIVDTYDNTPFVERCIFPISTAAIIMLLLYSSNMISEQGILWIQEILNTFVAFVGFGIVVANVNAEE